MPDPTAALRNQPLAASAEPLGAAHRFYLEGAIASAAPDWSVELYDEALGTATIIIMPEDADDEIGPTYFVHREGAAFCLDQLHWDSYSSIGRFTDLRDVARAVRARLLCQSSMAVPISATIH